MPPAVTPRGVFTRAEHIPSRGVYKFTVEIPEDEAGIALNALGGLPVAKSTVWVTIARLQEKAAVASPPRDVARSAQAKEAYRGKDEGERAVTRAAILCKDRTFQIWHGATDEADAVRMLCNALVISSRREIATNPEVLRLFQDIEFQFQQATGRAPVDMSA